MTTDEQPAAETPADLPLAALPVDESRSESSPQTSPESNVPVIAELVRPSADAPRPVWTALLVSVAAMVLAGIAATVVVAVAGYWDAGPEVFRSTDRLKAWIREFGATQTGLLVLLLPGQLVFLTAALAAALFSSRPLIQRLSLTPGELPVWTWLVFMAATPLVGFASSLLLSGLVDELSENLKMIESLLRSHADSNLLTLFLFVAVIPGVVEELMFRGYLQTRLAERWPPAMAIGVSAVVFSAAHLDLVHGLGVMLLGLWLGAIAWRAGSVWPAMLCHAANNAVAVLGLKYQPAEVVGVESDSTAVIALIICTPAFLLSLCILRSRPN